MCRSFEWQVGPVLSQPPALGKSRDWILYDCRTGLAPSAQSPLATTNRKITVCGWNQTSPIQTMPPSRSSANLNFMNPDSTGCALSDIASDPPERFGGPRTEPTIRDWARFDPVAAASLARVDAHRLALLEQEMRQFGAENVRLARMFYALHLGLEQLATSSDTSGVQELGTFLDILNAVPLATLASPSDE